MTPLPWLLVPPAHANTTDQAQFEPATVKTTPLVLVKILIEFWSFCSKFQLFWSFWTHLFDFRLFVWMFESRTQYARSRKTAKYRQDPEKCEKTRYFKSGYWQWQVKVSHVIDVLFLILKNTMGRIYTSRMWSIRKHGSLYSVKYFISPEYASLVRNTTEFFYQISVK